MSDTTQTPCDVCGTLCVHRVGAKIAVCRNPEHVKPGYYHEVNVSAPGVICPRCKRQNGPLSSVYVSAWDEYRDMCKDCRSDDARSSAWIYSGMAAKARRPAP